MLSPSELATRYPLLAGQVRTCRVCGCTDSHACNDPTHGPCWWVEPNLCSHCGEPMIVLQAFDRQYEIEPDGTIRQKASDTDDALWMKRARAALERAAFTAWDAFDV